MLGGPVPLVKLDGARVYSCSSCRARVSNSEDIVSKAFHGRHGRAFLFNRAVNVSLGPREERVLITGLHTVCDVHCIGCHAVLGWKYVSAYHQSQKYKENKFILEQKMLKKEGW